jgi:predicted aspartyl protease
MCFRFWPLALLWLAVVAGAQQLRVPFRLANPDLPLVLVDLTLPGGPAVTAVVDTGQGVAPLIVSVAAAEAARLQYREGDAYPATFAVGGGGAPRILRANAASFGLGGVNFPPMAVGVSDVMLPIGRAVGQSVTANLGYLFLRDYTVSFDYAARALILSRQRLAGGQTFELAPKKPLALVEARINGSGPFRLAVDTGATSSVLRSGVAARLGLPRGMTVPVMGAAGSTQAYMTTAGSVTLAGRTFRDFQFTVGDFLGALSTAAGAEIDGVLGANAFRGLVLTIDYPGRRLALTNP